MQTKVQAVPVARIETVPVDRASSGFGIGTTPTPRATLLALSLACITLALYNPVATFKFLNYDDNAYITDNLHVQAGLNWANLQWAFTTLYAANWHPLTWLSHMVDCQLFGLTPAGPHYVNLLLHALNAVLLFFLLQHATGKPGRSFVVGALFAIHPLNVGSVAWVAERKNMLSTLFCWLAIAAYGWYVQNGSKGRYLLVVLFFAMGLMAKPMIISLPFILLLLDLWPLRRMENTPGLRHLILEKLPLIALSIASGVITIVAQHSGGAMRTPTNFPFNLRFQNALSSYAEYLHKAIWPAKLAIFYPFPRSTLPWWDLSLAALLMIAISFAVLRWRRSHPYLLVGWLWYLMTLIPVIGIIQVGNQGMADRYAYLPLVGIFIAAVWLASDSLLPYSLLVKAGLVVILLLGLGTELRHQLPFYKDTVTVWSRAVEISPQSVFAEINLGEALKAEGRISDALPHFEKFVRQHEEVADVHYLYGYDLMLAGRVADAIPELNLALKLTRPTRADQREQTEQALGEAYSQLGKLPDAESHLQESLRIDPADVQSLSDMGWVLEREGKLDPAIAAFAASIKISATDFAYLHLGECFEQQGSLPLAASAYERAIAISPGSASSLAARQRLTALRRAALSPAKPESGHPTQ